MEKTARRLDLVIKAALKLEAATERPNVLAFIRSCYGGRVTHYDFPAALAALRKLTEEEQHALIAWALRQDKAA